MSWEVATFIVALFTLLATVGYGEMRLAELDEGLFPKDYVARFREAREKKLRWEQTREEREERRTQEERELRAETNRLSQELSIHLAATPPSSVPFSDTPEGYEGPIPDKVLLVTIINLGKTAAYEVTGWLRLESSYLEPVRKFSGGSTRVSREGDAYMVRIGGTEKSTLMPTPTAKLVFKVAVAVRSPGTTRIEYEFTTPVGAGVKDRKLLNIPDPKEQ